eukprot:Awhi_evm1s15268
MSLVSSINTRKKTPKLKVRFTDSVPGLTLSTIKVYNVREAPSLCSPRNALYFNFDFSDDDEANVNPQYFEIDDSLGTRLPNKKTKKSSLYDLRTHFPPSSPTNDVDENYKNNNLQTTKRDIIKSNHFHVKQKNCEVFKPDSAKIDDKKEVKKVNRTSGIKYTLFRPPIQLHFHCSEMKSSNAVQLTSFTFKPIFLQRQEIDPESLFFFAKVTCSNFEFTKKVFLRVSKDNWKTFTDIECHFESQSDDGKDDIFQVKFNLDYISKFEREKSLSSSVPTKLSFSSSSSLPSTISSSSPSSVWKCSQSEIIKSFEFCVRSHFPNNNETYWDNNNNHNYMVWRIPS